MNRKYFFVIAIIAAACFAFILSSIHTKGKNETESEVVVAPPVSPFKTSIVGVGIVEPSNESIFIGSPLNRIIEKIKVKVGERVKKGDILFELENSDLKAELQAQKIAYEVARQKLTRLKELPLPTDVAPAEAVLKMAEVELGQAKAQYDMVKELPDLRAISQEENNRRRFNLGEAEAKVQQAQADLARIKAGASKQDLAIAELEMEQVKAGLDRTETELKRTVVRSPIEGTVLQIKIHEGEITPQDTGRSPIMILGNIDTVNLRVSINEFDLPDFKANAPAVAYLPANKKMKFPLEYIRTEPVLVVKNNLSNDITEKVDSRVFQVIYKIKDSSAPLFINQEMDVFIETTE